MKPDTDYEEKYTEILKNIVLEAAKGIPCGIFLFGSRVMGKDHFASDFDLGIIGLEQEAFGRIKTAILNRVEESIIPWKADIVNFDDVSDSFRETAMKHTQWWLGSQEL